MFEIVRCHGKDEWSDNAVLNYIWLIFLKTQGRRIIKSHLPFGLLPPGLLDKCKVIYVSRNPKDTAVSFYYYQIGWPKFHGTFEACMEMFKDGALIYGDYFQHLIRDRPLSLS